MKINIPQSINKKWLIAHRGGRGEKPENTLESFEYAIDLNCGGIELDIRKCKTNELVIFHDYEIPDRLNSSGLSLKQMSLSQMQSINPNVPTLDEFFIMIGKKSITKDFIINIEIKDFGIIPSLIKCLEKHTYVRSETNSKEGLNTPVQLENLIISSLLHTELLLFRNKIPSIKVAPIYECMPLHAHQTLKVLNTNTLVICKFAITESSMDILRYSDSSIQSIRIWVYTVNTNVEANRLLKLGVNRIITDFPLKLTQ